MPVTVIHTGQASAKRLERLLSQRFEDRESVREPDVTIRWGLTDVPDPPGVVLNGRQALADASVRERIWTLLARYGIHTPKESPESEIRRLLIVK